jgi:hypothetical protein
VFARAGFDVVQIQPDAALACASLFGASLVPNASITEAYGQKRLKFLLRRVLGAVAVLAALPWVLVENYLLSRPALGIVFARVPQAGQRCDSPAGSATAGLMPGMHDV